MVLKTISPGCGVRASLMLFLTHGHILASFPEFGGIHNCVFRIENVTWSLHNVDEYYFVVQTLSN